MFGSLLVAPNQPQCHAKVHVLSVGETTNKPLGCLEMEQVT